MYKRLWLAGLQKSFYCAVIGLLVIGLVSCGGSGGKSNSNDSSTSSNSSSIASSQISHGLNARPSNKTCVAGDAPPGLVKLTRIFPRISFASPLGLIQVPGSKNNPFYVYERGGRIVQVPAVDDPDPSLAVTAATLDVIPSTGEDEVAMNSLVFHPDYVNNGRVFVTYEAVANPGPLEVRLSELQRAPDGIHFQNEKILLRLHKDNRIHNGGALAFGSDGYLYMSVGDDNGNFLNDPHLVLPEDPTNMYGKILRLDVNNIVAPATYAIPTDNPKWGGAQASAVWATGFRNPWRMSFDSLNQSLWVANVGNIKVEEVNVVSKGKDYGWPTCEGSCLPHNPQLEDPIYEYPHSQGSAAVIGGFVYRGTKIPELFGKYFFGDLFQQDVLALDTNLSKADPLYVSTVIHSPDNFASFAQDNSNELYVLGFDKGELFRIERSDNAGTKPLPTLLSQTGCFSTVSGGNPIPNDGVIAYDVAQRFWSDGADKNRYFAIPDGSTLDVSDAKDWILPPGGVTIKNFSLNNKIFETRFFVRYNDGAYGGYTYEWKDDLSDATLVGYEGKDKSINNQTWHYPSRGECLRCHNNSVNGSLSLESRQLNISHLYSQTNVTDNQLDALAFVGFLSTTNPVKLNAYPSEKKLNDASIDLDLRARSYLQVNCASCHHDKVGIGRAHWTASFDTAFEQRGLCNRTPFEIVNTSGDTNEKLIVPGNHSLSTLWLRASDRTDAYRMPPVSSNLVDDVGTQLIASWIDGFGNQCPSHTIGTQLPATLFASAADRVSDQGTADGCHLSWDVTGCLATSTLTPWYEFDVNVPTTRNFDITIFVTTGVPIFGPRPMSVMIDEKVVASGIQVTGTQNDWLTFANYLIPNVQISAGNHVVRIISEKGGTNLRSVSIQ